MKKVIVIVIVIIQAAACWAQSDDVFEQASAAYEMGHFEEVDSMLSEGVKHLKGENKVQAYRLLALSNIYMDNQETTEAYAGKLLALDPYYTAYNDSPRFADMLERLKKGKTTVSTASKVAETLEEVPVPVTLITEEMIEASGAKNVGDVIALYVPGISRVAGLEQNFAMHGVSGLTQENMLVMLDGHRMNSTTTNAGTLDYRISMDKIKQIEVLRGPASSLYGNVALTAVINIITKSGSDVGGTKVSARVGHFQTYDGSLLFGNGNLKTEYLAWASIYHSKGQGEMTPTLLTDYMPEVYPAVKRYIEGYNRKPTYDFGVKLRWGDFKLSATGNYCKAVPYYNLLEVVENSSYDPYGELNGEKPGASRNNIRADIEYSHDFGEDFSVTASAFVSEEKVSIYNVLGDVVDSIFAVPLAMALGIEKVATEAVWQNISWQDYHMGVTASGTYSYHWPRGMYGSVMAGVQYENLILSSGDLKLGSHYTRINTNVNYIFNQGSEHTLSGFLQLKHNFTKRLIFNGGLRYDHKRRINTERLNNVSPRVSLIWLANNVMSLKGGYTSSFVDAPVFYRGSNITLLSSASGLKPEKMNAVQLGASFNWKPLHLTYEVNCFYNAVRDLVYYGDNQFTNAGKITIGGIESIAQYANKGTFANVNCTYQYPFNIENYYKLDDHSLMNIPKFLLNAVVSQRFINSPKIGQMMVRANMHYQTKVDCLVNNPFIKMLLPGMVFEQHQGDYAEVGAGLQWKSRFGLSVSVDAHNLFDKRYYYGGQLAEGVPGMGFNLLGKVSFEF